VRRAKTGQRGLTVQAADAAEAALGVHLVLLGREDMGINGIHPPILTDAAVPTALKCSL
jgi:hypothetical protein